jgi:hypothetical protein
MIDKRPIEITIIVGCLKQETKDEKIIALVIDIEGS